MKQFLFVEDDRLPSSFESYLMFCRWYYLRSEEAKSKVKNIIERTIDGIKVDDIYIINKGQSIIYKIDVRGHFLDNNEQVDMTFLFNFWSGYYYEPFQTSNFRLDEDDSYSKIKENILPDDIQKIIQYFNVMSGLCIKKSFRLDDQEYKLIVDTPLSGTDPTCKFQRIRIQSYDKDDIYYYDLSTGVLYAKIDGELKYLNPKVQTDILSKLPNITYREISSYLCKELGNRLKPVFLTTSGAIIGNKLGRFDKLKYGKRNIVIGYLGTLPDIDEKTQENGVSFTELLVSSGYTSEISSESLSRKDSIKNLLLKLRNQEFDRKTFTKIRISEEIFFSSVTPSKKEIDPFFKDPKIMELCDLSKIDFTNAAIAGFSFEGTDARIQLSKVFGHSIKDSNLRGIFLIGQDLDGIVADGADLRETHVFVSIEKTSIDGTKFSTSSSFMSGITKLSDEDARMLGINIEDTGEKEIKLTI